MLALRRAGALLARHRLPGAPAPTLIKRGVKSSRSSKGTTSTNTTTSSGTTTPTAARRRKGRDPPINPAFFKVDGATPPTPLEGEDTAEGGGWVVGEVTDHAIDLHDVRPVSRRRMKEGMERLGLDSTM